MIRPALGIIETTGLTGALKATHAATSAGDVAIASAVRTEAGCMAVKIEGDWNVVQKAVEAGARAADAAGELVAMHVIPRTDQDLSRILPYNQFLARFLVMTPQSAATPKGKSTEPKPRRPVKTSTPKTPTVTPRERVKPAPVPEPVVEPTPSVESAPVTPASTHIPAATPTPESSTPITGLPPMEELEAMSVVKLRRWARGVQGLPIQGRQISMANKQQLLEAIRALNDTK